jgi:hypothetical protein
LKFFPGQVHQKIDLFLPPFEVLQGKGVEGSTFDSELKAVEETFLEDVSPFLMATHGLV